MAAFSAALFFSCAVAAAVAVDDGAQVTASKLNVRASPGLQSSTVGSLSKGERVRVVQVSSFTQTIDGLSAPWAEVVGYGARGWVFSGYLTSALGEGPNSPGQKPASDYADGESLAMGSLPASMSCGEGFEYVEEAGDAVGQSAKVTVKEGHMTVGYSFGDSGGGGGSFSGSINPRANVQSLNPESFLEGELVVSFIKEGPRAYRLEANGSGHKEKVGSQVYDRGWPINFSMTCRPD